MLDGLQEYEKKVREFGVEKVLTDGSLENSQNNIK